MTVSADEFIRRFLLQVLPRRLHRIRYYGFLGNRTAPKKLAHCRDLLGLRSRFGVSGIYSELIEGPRSLRPAARGQLRPG